MRDAELLSRLLAGDLPEGEARALRARIQQEPELSRLWEAMRGLPAALISLPEEPPPAAVVQAAMDLASSPPLAAPRPARPWGTILALAAAALLAVGLWPRARPTLLLAEGQQLVEGEARVLAGGVVVDVDGRALILVEPSGPAARVEGAEDPNMRLETIGAALGGALVTVAVYEGSAWMGGEERAPVAVEPGERRTVIVGGPEGSAPGRAQAAGERSSGDGQPRTLAEAQQEIAALREELATAKLEGAVSRGQLTQQIGAPSPWPESPAEVVKPAVWEKNLSDALARHGAGKVIAIDCEEYPCVAVLAPPPNAEDWKENFEEVFTDLSEGTFANDASVHAMATAHDDGETVHNLMGLAIYPATEGGDETVRDRTNYRLGALLEEQTPELK